MIAWLPPGIEERAVVDGAAARGVGAYGLRPYHRDQDAPGGLLFGYGRATEAEIEEGIRLVGEAVDEVRAAS